MKVNAETGEVKRRRRSGNSVVAGGGVGWLSQRVKASLGVAVWRPPRPAACPAPVTPDKRSVARASLPRQEDSTLRSWRTRQFERPQLITRGDPREGLVRLLEVPHHLAVGLPGVLSRESSTVP